MKKTTLLVAIIFVASFVTAQIVNIPDANFKAALIANLSINTNGDGEIQVGEALATDSINVSYKHILDLTGIEAFTKIIYLDCSYNMLSTLEISNNINLIKLRCSDNSINKLDVSNNVVLEIFNCMFVIILI